MWMMTNDERTVTPQEWKCLKLGLILMQERLTMAKQYGDAYGMSGIAAFDDLTIPQRMALLANICMSLLDPAIPAPPRSSVQDGALAALLFAFWNQIEMELDLSDDDAYPFLESRRALLDTLDATTHPFPNETPSAEYLPDLLETDSEIWFGAFSSFEARFIDDVDYLLDAVSDLPSERADDIKEELGLASDYFVTIAPEPSDRELITVRQVFARLLDMPVPDDDGKYPAFYDRYTGLYFGPCTEEQTEKWQGHPWIEKTSHDQISWDCEYAVWEKNFSAALAHANPADANQSADFETQREQRRKAALDSLGNWLPF